MKSFVSVIANVPSLVQLVMMQVDDHVEIRLISQLIISISRVLQKLPLRFHSTDISMFLLLRSAGVLPVIFTLDLNNSESVKNSIWLISVIVP